MKKSTVAVLALFGLAGVGVVIYNEQQKRKAANAAAGTKTPATTLPTPAPAGTGPNTTILPLPTPPAAVPPATVPPVDNDSWNPYAGTIPGGIPMPAPSVDTPLLTSPVYGDVVVLENAHAFPLN